MQIIRRQNGNMESATSRPDGSSRPDATSRLDGTSRPDATSRSGATTQPGGSSRPDAATTFPVLETADPTFPVLETAPATVPVWETAATTLPVPKRLPQLSRCWKRPPLKRFWLRVSQLLEIFVEVCTHARVLAVPKRRRRETPPNLQVAYWKHFVIAFLGKARCWRAEANWKAFFDELVWFREDRRWRHLRALTYYESYRRAVELNILPPPPRQFPYYRRITPQPLA